MKKIHVFFIVIMFIIKVFCYGIISVDLESKGIFQPFKIAVLVSEIVILEKKTGNIFILNKDNYNIVKKINKSGEGPGEYVYPFNLNIFGDKFWISEAKGKVMFFNRFGEFLEELKLFNQTLFSGGKIIYYAGPKKYVYKQITFNQKDKKIKLCYKVLNTNITLNLGLSELSFKRFRNYGVITANSKRIFLVKNTEKALIEVYGYNNSKKIGKISFLYSEVIKYSIEKISAFKDKLKKHKMDPKLFELPENKPIIETIITNQNKLFVITNSIKKNLRRILVYEDLKLTSEILIEENEEVIASCADRSHLYVIYEIDGNYQLYKYKI